MLNRTDAARVALNSLTPSLQEVLPSLACASAAGDDSAAMIDARSATDPNRIAGIFKLASLLRDDCVA